MSVMGWVLMEYLVFSGVMDSRKMTQSLMSLQCKTFISMPYKYLHSTKIHTTVFFACIMYTFTATLPLLAPFPMALIHDRESKEVHLENSSHYLHWCDVSMTQMESHKQRRDSFVNSVLKTSSKQWSTMICVVQHSRHLHSALLLNILFLCMMM